MLFSACCLQRTMPRCDEARHIAHANMCCIAWVRNVSYTDHCSVGVHSAGVSLCALNMIWATAQPRVRRWNSRTPRSVHEVLS